MVRINRALRRLIAQRFDGSFSTCSKEYVLSLPGSMLKLLSRGREIYAKPQTAVTGSLRMLGFNSFYFQFLNTLHSGGVSKLRDRNLVDPASSHMLVSKIKPCMSQYKSLYGETANGSLKQL